MGVTANGRPGLLRTSCVKGFRKSVLRKWARSRLKSGKGAKAGSVASIRLIAETGCDQVPPVACSGQGCCKEPGLKWLNAMPGSVN